MEQGKQNEGSSISIPIFSKQMPSKGFRLELLVQYTHCHSAALPNKPPRLAPKQETWLVGTYCTVKKQGQETEGAWKVQL